MHEIVGAPEIITINKPSVEYKIHIWLYFPHVNFKQTLYKSLKSLLFSQFDQNQ